jgi:iron complex outermembrane receptor protein
MSALSIPATVKSLIRDAAGRRAACTLAGLALFAAGPAFADDVDDVDDVDGAPEELVLDSVMITSHRTIDEIRDQPVSVSAIAGEDLFREDASSLEAIAKRLANVKWNYGNSWTSNYSIRGIGKIATNQAADPSVGININGIAYAYNALASFNLYDIDTAAVLRGPQGLRGGKNSVLGQVTIINKGASFEPSSEFSIGYSAFEDQSWGKANGSLKAFAAQTGTLIDEVLAYRVALNVDKGGGWLLNKYNTDNQYINSDRVAGRVHLLFTPFEGFQARFTADVNPRMQEYANIGSTNFFFGPTPATFANGAANTALNDAQRLSRSWFTRNADYTVVDDYFSTKYINSDSQQALVTGRNAYTLELGWELGENTSLVALTGFADYYFNAFRDDEGTVFDVQTAAGQNIWYNQWSQEVRLETKFGDLVDAVGGVYWIRNKNTAEGNNAFGSDGGAWFATNAQYGRLDANSAGRLLMIDSLADLWRKTPTTALTKAPAAFASLDWHLADRLTVNTGARVTRTDRTLKASAYIFQQGYGADLNTTALASPVVQERVAQRYFGTTYAALTTAQRAQITDAAAIRTGRLGVLFGETEVEPYKGTQVNWSVSPSFELNDHQTFYALVGQGSKSGIPVVLSNAGVVRSQLAKPERNNNFELGSKSTLLNGNLLVDASIYLNDIKNYQQNVFFVDELQTQINGGIPVYVSGVGNVPKVRAKGVELDVTYSGFESVDVRFSGAYNDVYYREYTTAPYPVERANEGSFQDISGATLPGASKVSFDIGLNYHRPVLNDKEFRATWNTSYVSKYKSDNALSDYSWIKANSITDATFSIGTQSRSWTAGIFIKNLFNDDTPRNRTWNAWAPQIPRQYGINFSGRL